MTISPFKLGVLLAAVVAGPPLYAAVQAGGMPEGTALSRAGLIAFACVIGVLGIKRVIERFEAEQEETRDALHQVLQAARQADQEAAASAERDRPRD